MHMNGRTCGRRRGSRSGTARMLLAALAAMSSAALLAQPPAAGGAQSARDVAPYDLAGQWVSVVTEDWRHRMMVPPAGDIQSVPLNAAGIAAAEAWDPQRDAAEGVSCRAFGAAGLMRLPGRLRIEWENDAVLRIEADAGEQVRRLHFGEPPTSGMPSLQGLSRAEWRLSGPAARRNGTIRAITTNLLPGYLRRNGVPYSADTVVTEHFDLLTQPDGSEWLVVQTIVEDPVYLTQPFITSTNFRREHSRDGWDPRSCSDY
jgi:hypothetical protein